VSRSFYRVYATASEKDAWPGGLPTRLGFNGLLGTVGPLHRWKRCSRLFPQLPCSVPFARPSIDKDLRAARIATSILSMNCRRRPSYPLNLLIQATRWKIPSALFGRVMIREFMQNSVSCLASRVSRIRPSGGRTIFSIGTPGAHSRWVSRFRNSTARKP